MDIAPELIYLTLLLADARQSQYALDHPPLRESNPLVNRWGVKKYFAASALTYAAISYTLPRSWAPYWQYGTIAVQAGFVGHNAQVGARIGF